MRFDALAALIGLPLRYVERIAMLFYARRCCCRAASNFIQRQLSAASMDSAARDTQPRGHAAISIRLRSNLLAI